MVPILFFTSPPPGLCQVLFVGSVGDGEGRASSTEAGRQEVRNIKIYFLSSFTYSLFSHFFSFFLIFFFRFFIFSFLFFVTFSMLFVTHAVFLYFFIPLLIFLFFSPFLCRSPFSFHPFFLLPFLSFSCHPFFHFLIINSCILEKVVFLKKT